LGFDFQDGERPCCNLCFGLVQVIHQTMPTHQSIFATSNSQVQSQELPTESGERMEPMEQIAIPVMPDFKDEFEISPEHKKCV
jgi:hypothetical protein